MNPTITQEALIQATRLDTALYRTAQTANTVRILRDLARIVEQQDKVIAGAVSKPVRDALLGGSL